MVVPSVRHEVDPDLTTQTLGQIASGSRSAQDFTHTVKENRRIIRLHPIAYIKVIARRRRGHQVAKVPRQSRRPKPADCERCVRSTVETPYSARFSSRPKRQEMFRFRFASNPKVRFS